MDLNTVIIFSLIVFLTLISFIIIKIKDEIIINKNKKKITLSIDSILSSIIEEANLDNFESVKKLLEKTDYGQSYLLSASIKRSIYFNLSIAFSNLIYLADQLDKKIDLLELKYLFFYAQNEGSWGISTILIRLIGQSPDGELFLKKQFENSFSLKRPKECLVIFCGLSKKLRGVFIEKYYKKIMICCYSHLSYFLEGTKVYEEKLTKTVLDCIYRDCYLALLLSKKKEIQTINELVGLYFSSQNPEILKNIYLVYYFYGRCLFECEYFKEALHYFYLTNKKKPHFEDVDSYLNKLNNLGYSSQSGSSNKNYKKNHKKDQANYNSKLKNDPFAILQINLTATKEEIKKAYRQKMIQYHPDKVASLGKKFEEIANEKTKEINQAYQECLRIIGTED